MGKFRVLMTDTIFPDTTIEQEELRRIDADFVLASPRRPRDPQARRTTAVTAS